MIWDGKERLLTVEEAAGRLRCSERTVRRWIKGGELHAERVKRTWLIPLSALPRCAQHHDKRLYG